MPMDKNNQFDAMRGDDDDNQDLLNRLKAGQQDQQSNVLPTERQPLSPQLMNPQDEALQHPAISPEELIAAGAAGPLARGASVVGQAVKPQLSALLADETGVLKAPSSINIPLVKRLMGGAEEGAQAPAAKLFGDNDQTAAARGVADITSDMANNGLATAQDQAKNQQALSRAVDMQQRDEKYKALRKMIGK
jgi:hypothetical protein